MAVEFVPKEEEVFKVDDQTVKTLCTTLSHTPREIRRTDLLDFGSTGFLLHEVLEPQECRDLVSRAEEAGLEELTGVKKSYRNCTRLAFTSDNLSAVVFSRVRPFLSDIHIAGDPHDHFIHGVAPMVQGTWTPLKLNPVFRFCRYEANGHFAPHFDGHLVESSDIRSMVTLMLYLNGDFDGGSTNFIDQKQTLYMDEHGRYCAEEKNILHRIHPEAGMAIVFNHHRLHEGGALLSGVKYILRTDIMYQRVEGPAVPDEAQEALLQVQQAERLEAEGDCMQAMALYRKAFKMSPQLAKSYGN